MTSASADASSLASRGRSCRPSAPTPWWMLKVTIRTGMGGRSGPGAGFVTEDSLSGGRERHVQDRGEPVGSSLAHRQQEPRLSPVEDELADLVAEERARLLLPLPLGRVRRPPPGGAARSATAPYGSSRS